MPVTIAVPKESAREEARVALVPEFTDRLIHQHGVKISIEAGCGRGAGFYDPDYGDVAVHENFANTVKTADIVLKVNPPSIEEASMLPVGSVLITLIPAFQYADVIRVLLKRRVTTLAMDLLPRITRAQPMDVLSSQATVAGYKAALLAAEYSPRLFPMLTTAAGTIRPSRVIVLGAGVAGLQAIATCRRLGAQVEAYDIRNAAREQIESLGARMIDTGVVAENANGTARGLNKEEKQKQHDVLAERMSHAHVVICAAAIPGRRAPRIVTEDMVEGMLPDTIVVDMASETGGNCELSKPGEMYLYGDTMIIGPINLPSRGAVHASEMYSRNLFNMLKLVISDANLNLNWEDEIVARCLLTHQGNLHHAATATLMDLPCAPPIADASEQSAESIDQAAGWIPEPEDPDVTHSSQEPNVDGAPADLSVSDAEVSTETQGSDATSEPDADQELPKDDLTRIEGVGPALQSKLNEFGYYRFADLAVLNADAVETLDRQLELDGHIEARGLGWSGNATTADQNMIGFNALYLFLLAGVAGYVLIARVPSILHLPLMSGSNFIHGIVLIGAMLVLGHADGTLQTVIGFLAVVAAAANAVGGYVVTDRMLAMFEAAQAKQTRPAEASDESDAEVSDSSQNSDNHGESDDATEKSDS